ncbi:MAG: hypothetical protein HYU64_01300 [Armatimonadetes bacterium]|nr:hypothetical protein [Armatimonadota bacterium]
MNEIIELSRKYGIITPYTSFLVEEPKKADHGARPRGGDEERSLFRSTLPKTYSGESAVGTSKDIQQYKQQEGLYQPSPPSPEVAQAQEKTKQVGKRTFYQQGDFWVQAEYNQQEVVTVKFGSKEYFDFLKDEEASKSLSIAPQVIFQLKGKWIKIVQ